MIYLYIFIGNHLFKWYYVFHFSYILVYGFIWKNMYFFNNKIIIYFNEIKNLNLYIIIVHTYGKTFFLNASTFRLVLGLANLFHNFFVWYYALIFRFILVYGIYLYMISICLMILCFSYLVFFLNDFSYMYIYIFFLIFLKMKCFSFFS